jgi:hypothetical protein
VERLPFFERAIFFVIVHFWAFSFQLSVYSGVGGVLCMDLFGGLQIAPLNGVVGRTCLGLGMG